MDGLDLYVRRPLRPVSNIDLQGIQTWPQALEAASKASGLQDKSLAIECGIDAALFSRMLSGQAGWTGEKLTRYMDACGSELPMLWLLHQRGYDVEALRQRETELQQQLRQEREARERAESELATIKNFMREVRA